MGAIARANVQESVAWVRQFNLFADDFQNIEFGFGDINLDADEEFVSLNMYESISPVILAKMQAAQEISGYAVNIDPNQNVLVDDMLRISYVIVPVGVATRIYVEEGLSLTAK